MEIDEIVDPILLSMCRMCTEQPGKFQIVPQLRERIFDCYQIKIQSYDGLSQIICDTCKIIVNEFHASLKSYQAKQAALVEKRKQLLNKSSSSSTNASKNPRDIASVLKATTSTDKSSNILVVNTEDVIKTEDEVIEIIDEAVKVEDSIIIIDSQPDKQIDQGEGVQEVVDAKIEENMEIVEKKVEKIEADASSVKSETFSERNGRIYVKYNCLICGLQYPNRSFFKKHRDSAHKSLMSKISRTTKLCSVQLHRVPMTDSPVSATAKEWVTLHQEKTIKYDVKNRYANVTRHNCENKGPAMTCSPTVRQLEQLRKRKYSNRSADSFLDNSWEEGSVSNASITSSNFINDDSEKLSETSSNTTSKSSNDSAAIEALSNDSDNKEEVVDDLNNVKVSKKRKRVSRQSKKIAKALIRQEIDDSNEERSPSPVLSSSKKRRRILSAPDSSGSEFEDKQRTWQKSFTPQKSPSSLSLILKVDHKQSGSKTSAFKQKSQTNGKKHPAEEKRGKTSTASDRRMSASDKKSTGSEKKAGTSNRRMSASDKRSTGSEKKMGISVSDKATVTSNRRMSASNSMTAASENMTTATDRRLSLSKAILVDSDKKSTDSDTLSSSDENESEDAATSTPNGEPVDTPCDLTEYELTQVLNKAANMVLPLAAYHSTPRMDFFRKMLKSRSLDVQWSQGAVKILKSWEPVHRNLLPNENHVPYPESPQCKPNTETLLRVGSLKYLKKDRPRYLKQLQKEQVQRLAPNSNESNSRKVNANDNRNSVILNSRSVNTNASSVNSSAKSVGGMTQLNVSSGSAKLDSVNLNSGSGNHKSLEKLLLEESRPPVFQGRLSSINPVVGIPRPVNYVENESLCEKTGYLSDSLGKTPSNLSYKYKSVNDNAMATGANLCLIMNRSNVADTEQNNTISSPLSSPLDGNQSEKTTIRKKSVKITPVRENRLASPSKTNNLPVIVDTRSLASAKINANSQNRTENCDTGNENGKVVVLQPRIKCKPVAQLMPQNTNNNYAASTNNNYPMNSVKNNITPPNSMQSMSYSSVSVPVITETTPNVNFGKRTSFETLPMLPQQVLDECLPLIPPVKDDLANVQIQNCSSLSNLANQSAHFASKVQTNQFYNPVGDAIQISAPYSVSYHNNPSFPVIASNPSSIATTSQMFSPSSVSSHSQTAASIPATKTASPSRLDSATSSPSTRNKDLESEGMFLKFQKSLMLNGVWLYSKPRFHNAKSQSIQYLTRFDITITESSSQNVEIKNCIYIVRLLICIDESIVLLVANRKNSNPNGEDYEEIRNWKELYQQQLLKALQQKEVLESILAKTATYPENLKRKVDVFVKTLNELWRNHATTGSNNYCGTF